MPRAAGLLRSLRRIGGRTAREPGLVNHVSLGTHCHMAQVLKTLGLRTWSGPFDWIFSTPGMVRDCLADDFATLLDRSQFETIPVAERPEPGIGRCRHRLYRERYDHPCVFNHHDPASSAADYTFLTEGVRRFRTALGTPRARNQFWMMTALDTQAEVVAHICDVLARHGDGNRLIVIQVAAGQTEPRAALRQAGPNLRWLSLETRSASVGLRFADPADDRALAALVERESAHPGRP
ncbi:papain-like cysteine peptidase [Methylobacterium planeticum]|uniref:Papain-like cysteine peptidase n=1 Tax=Methylobacterium planeticum TaxID=2615211 RepID=A0A6N6MRS0_9HYPH|nr:DUF1796 family putative cysteine peptidase [Methylobacterium planeticum]KAB1072869.1 papain-like cysteine peptidase [Methylobacterium planeticum]